jgi:hypothetical protein
MTGKISGERALVRCLNCDEIRDHAAHGLCFACYRSEQRAAERIPKDRHTPGVNKQQAKLFKGLAAIMGGLHILSVSKSDSLWIRRILEPYLSPIALLNTVYEPDKGTGINPDAVGGGTHRAIAILPDSEMVGAEQTQGEPMPNVTPEDYAPEPEESDPDPEPEPSE